MDSCALKIGNQAPKTVTIKKCLYIHIFSALLCFCFSGCTNLPTYDSVYLQTEITTGEQLTTESTLENSSTNSAITESETFDSALLSSPADIHLCNTDDTGKAYTFTYDSTTFQAIYTPDHWKIIDSYQIQNTDDMFMICEALKSEHPIHSADYRDWRTAEDMAYEWTQHNLAYALLSDDSEWKSHAKNVDFNPEDQGKSLIELYQAQTQ